jgi:oligosaccharyltransferase complex subunit gamma
MKPFLCLLFFYICIISNVHSKEDILSEKIQQLTDWSLKKPIIRLNNDRFKQYVKTAPRNYSMIIMLTALSPQRQCGICKQALDEFQIVAQSYRYSSAFTNRVFFALVDFDDGSEVFQYLGLNSAPVFIHFPPKMKPKKNDQMDISRQGFSAEQISKWIQDRVDVQIHIFRPPNYSGFLLIVLLVTMIGGLLYIKRNSLEFLYNQVVWGVFVILAILICISGQIWNSIRGSPFVHRNPQTGQIGLFSGSSGFQFIAETYIVFSLYFGICAGMILLNEAPKLTGQNGKRKAMTAVLGILMVVFFFSFLLSVFRAKYQGYPYSFLIK